MKKTKLFLMILISALILFILYLVILSNKISEHTISELIDNGVNFDCTYEVIDESSEVRGSIKVRNEEYFIERTSIRLIPDFLKNSPSYDPERFKSYNIPKKSYGLMINDKSYNWDYQADAGSVEESDGIDSLKVFFDEKRPYQQNQESSYKCKEVPLLLESIHNFISPTEEFLLPEDIEFKEFQIQVVG